MNKGILIGLGLVVALGLIYIATSRRPEKTDPPSAGASTPATAPGIAPVSEFDRGSGGSGSKPASPSAVPPLDPQNTAAASAPGMPKSDPRVSRVDGKVYMNEPITLTRAMHSEDTSPMDDVSAVGTALRYYQLVFKENPVGSLNEEIVAQLMGGNPKNIVVLPPDHPDINAKGELVDRWGTPYFFHGLTRTAMDVWSAGPDLKFGSPDDVKLGIDEEFGDQLGLLIDP